MILSEPSESPYVAPAQLEHRDVRVKRISDRLRMVVYAQLSTSVFSVFLTDFDKNRHLNWLTNLGPFVAWMAIIYPMIVAGCCRFRNFSTTHAILMVSVSICLSILSIFAMLPLVQ